MRGDAFQIWLASFPYITYLHFVHNPTTLHTATYDINLSMETKVREILPIPPNPNHHHYHHYHDKLHPAK